MVVSGLRFDRTYAQAGRQAGRQVGGQTGDSSWVTARQTERHTGQKHKKPRLIHTLGSTLGHNGGGVTHLLLALLI